MRNDEVARVFARIADLLELKGESGSRFRSYQRTARSIEHWAVSIGQFPREGGLKNIPGVGEAIAKKTEELANTERLPYYKRRAAELPPGIKHLLTVPGIGRKTALPVAHDLQVSITEDLEVAAEDGRLASLPQFGDKATENLLRSLRFGVGVARRARCTRNDILNTAPWPRFQEIVQCKRKLALAPATG
jgi:DNA polymerase (family 10)